jgi:hypothetical protein
MADKTLKINETRNAFIAGVYHAAASVVKAKETLTKLNVSEIDMAIASTFLDATIAEIKENKQPIARGRKQRSDKKVVAKIETVAEVDEYISPEDDDSIPG